MNDATYPHATATELHWRTASRSQGQNDCVEVAPGGRGERWVRDTKDRRGGTLTLTAAAWAAFLGHTQAGPSL